MTYRLLQINLAIIVFGVLLFSYWLFLDGFINPPFTLNVDPLALQTDKTVYHPGDTVAVYSDYCKNRDASSVISWSLIDTVKISYPTKSANIPKGCNKGWFNVVELPTIMADDTYHLEAASVVNINPASAVTYNYKTVTFTVINHKI